MSFSGLKRLVQSESKLTSHTIQSFSLYPSSGLTKCLGTNKGKRVFWCGSSAPNKLGEVRERREREGKKISQVFLLVHTGYSPLVIAESETQM